MLEGCFASTHAERPQGMWSTYLVAVTVVGIGLSSIDTGRALVC